MDTGETKAEPAVLDLAVLHGQVGARPSSSSLCHGTRCAGQATASARKSQSTCVHGHKNGTWNLMFLDEHPQISVKSPYPSPNQTGFCHTTSKGQNPTPRHWKPSIPVFTPSKTCSLSFSPTSVSSFHLAAGANKHNLEHSCLHRAQQLCSGPWVEYSHTDKCVWNQHRIATQNMSAASSVRCFQEDQANRTLLFLTKRYSVSHGPHYFCYNATFYSMVQFKFLIS